MSFRTIISSSVALSLLVLLSSSAPAQQAFESEIRAFEAADLRNPPPANSILFIGSSTIAGWRDVQSVFPEYHVLNRGFGGSQASDVLYFFNRVVAPYRPALIAFYEGDNDLAAGKSVDQVFGDWTNFTARVRQEMPNAHVLFISVKPSPSRASLMPKQRELNQRVLEHANADPRLHFADVFTPMLNQSGQPRPELFLSDNLHMNEQGYAVWRSVVVPAVEAWAEEYPISVKRLEQGTLLIDFGDASLLSGGDSEGTSTHWNNVTSAGTSNTGSLSNLIRINGQPSAAILQMVSRFNGANENGTAASAEFPASATRDSLFGNTETFNGQADVTPVFRLSGLEPEAAFRFVFYASRMSVGDNRETRYTVNGLTTAANTLNAANNIDNVAVIAGLQPDTAGEFTIALAPGPNNNNANHFTYLGVLRVEPENDPEAGFLFDFGASGSVTTAESVESPAVWNNLTPEIGATDDGVLFSLLDSKGAPTPISLAMLSRFNGANLNGTASSTLFPQEAAQDSLYGNSEPFGGLGNVTPAFKFQNLASNAVYNFDFFASRTGVSDNRETRYAVTGNATAAADLNASNNDNEFASISGMRADGVGEIHVSLSPGPNNNNANHFTYLGVLRLEWEMLSPNPPIEFGLIELADGLLTARLLGAPGMVYQVQQSSNLLDWTTIGAVELATNEVYAELPMEDAAGFFRLRQ